MTKTKIKTYTLQIFGRLFPQLIAVFTSSVIIKNSDIKTYGEYILLLSLLSFPFGVIGSTLDSDFQRTNNLKLIQETLSAKIITHIIITPLILIIAHYLGFSIHITVMLIFAVFFQQSVETKIAYDRILGKDNSSFIYRVIPSFSFLTFIFIFNSETLNDITLLYSLSWALQAFFLANIYKSIKIEFKKSFDKVKQNFMLLISILLTQVYGNVDAYLIKFFWGNEDVGAFKIAYSFSSVGIPIAGALCFVYLNKISNALILKNKQIFTRTYLSQLLLSGILGISISIGIYLIFPYLSKRLYGDSYLLMINPANILSFAMMFNMLMMTVSYTLIALKEDRLLALITGFGVVLYLCSSLILIKKFSSSGASYSMLLVYITLFFTSTMILKYKITKYFKTASKQIDNK